MRSGGGASAVGGRGHAEALPMASIYDVMSPGGVTATPLASDATTSSSIATPMRFDAASAVTPGSARAARSPLDVDPFFSSESAAHSRGADTE